VRRQNDRARGGPAGCPGSGFSDPGQHTLSTPRQRCHPDDLQRSVGEKEFAFSFNADSDPLNQKSGHFRISDFTTPIQVAGQFTQSMIDFCTLERVDKEAAICLRCPSHDQNISVGQ